MKKSSLLLHNFAVILFAYSELTHASERKNLNLERKYSNTVMVRLNHDPEPISYKVLRDVHDKLMPIANFKHIESLNELCKKAQDLSYVWDPLWIKEFRTIGLLDGNQFAHEDIARAIRALLYVDFNLNTLRFYSPAHCVKKWL